MVKKEMVTTIKKLIQRMKDLKVSTFAALELWISWYNDGSHVKDEIYERISGFIWGLYSTEFITEYEKDCLLEDINRNYLFIG